MPGMAAHDGRNTHEARTRRHGAERVLYYGCSAYARKGKSICPNGLMVGADELESAVMFAVEDCVLDPLIIEEVLTRALARLVIPDDNREAKELTRIERELQNLVDAIATTGGNAVLIAEFQRRELERNRMRAALLAKRPVLELRELSAKLRERLTQWTGLMRRNRAEGQQALRAIIEGRLTLTPQDGTYAFSGTASLMPIIAGLVPHKVASPMGTAQGWPLRVAGFSELKRDAA